MIDLNEMEVIVRDFAATWKSGMNHINTFRMTCFADFRNGTEILKKVLTKVSYHRAIHVCSMDLPACCLFPRLHDLTRPSFCQ